MVPASTSLRPQFVRSPSAPVTHRKIGSVRWAHASPVQAVRSWFPSFTSPSSSPEGTVTRPQGEERKGDEWWRTKGMRGTVWVREWESFFFILFLQIYIYRIIILFLQYYLYLHLSVHVIRNEWNKDGPTTKRSKRVKKYIILLWDGSESMKEEEI